MTLSPHDEWKLSRSPQERKREETKREGNNGEEFSGKIVNKRTMGPACKCKKKGFEKIGGLENVSPIFELFLEYW